MAAAAAAPQLNPTFKAASPPFFVEHLFFKSYPVLLLPNPASSDELLHRSAHSLSCSLKYGVLVIVGQKTEQVVIVPANELLDVQTKAGNSHQKQVELGQIPHITVNNHPSFGSPPVIVSISNGEEYVAFDTVRNGGVSFVLIFKLDQFLTMGSKCQPIVEIRASPREGTKVSGIAWNPGENMNNMLATNCDDGTLQLAVIKGVGGVEMCSYKDVVRSMCWSPKGKQLVVGKGDGSLCQLKLDLSEAKKILGPGPGRTPSALFWTSTTQFMINYVVDNKDIDLMQLDLPKGAAPMYTNFGDAFVSDRVDALAKCSFIPILPWNILICTSNTINDLLVIGKGLHENSENWIVADLNDNRRAAIPIDNFCVGATLFTGYESPIVFNEIESYQSVPVVFVLSQTGTLSSFALVNSKGNAPSVFSKVSNPLPPQLFAANKPTTTINPIQQPIFGGGGDGQKVQPPLFQLQPQQPPITNTSTAPLNFNIFGTGSQPSQTTGINIPPQQINFAIPPPQQQPQQGLQTTGFNFSAPTVASTTLIPHTVSSTTTTTTANLKPLFAEQPKISATTTIQKPLFQPAEVQLPASNAQANKQQQPPMFDIKSLSGAGGLPTLQQVEDLKRIVDEKRAQGGFREVSNDSSTADNEPDMDDLLLEVEKFQKRLELYHKRKSDTEQKISNNFNELRKEHEKDVIAPLNLMEDFVNTLKETKAIQTEEVNGIKERIFSHYTELEYAKALGERNKDPKYIQLLLAQPMDAGRAKKFGETEKLYQYIKNQNEECQRFYRMQHQQQQSSFNQNASALQGIYQTLANHSQIIRKLAHNVNSLRTQIGLNKTPGIEDSRIFQVPTMGHNYYYEKKPLLKERPVIPVRKSNVPKIKVEKDKEDIKITLDDLTAGMSRVKLNKLKEASYNNGMFFTEQKPMKITAKKLESLTKIVSKMEEIEVTTDTKNYVDPFDISVKSRARSRNLINKLNDKPLTPEPLSSSSTPTAKTDGKKLDEKNKAVPIKLEQSLLFKAPPPLVDSKPVVSKPAISSTPDKITAATTTSSSLFPASFGTGGKIIPPAESSPTLRSILVPEQNKTTTTTVPKPTPVPTVPSVGFTLGSSTSSTTTTALSSIAAPPSSNMFGTLSSAPFNFSSSSPLFGTSPSSTFSSLSSNSSAQSTTTATTLSTLSLTTTTTAGSVDADSNKTTTFAFGGGGGFTLGGGITTSSGLFQNQAIKSSVSVPSTTTNITFGSSSSSSLFGNVPTNASVPSTLFATTTITPILPPTTVSSSPKSSSSTLFDLGGIKLSEATTAAATTTPTTATATPLTSSVLKEKESVDVDSSKSGIFGGGFTLSGAAPIASTLFSSSSGSGLLPTPCNDAVVPNPLSKIVTPTPTISSLLETPTESPVTKDEAVVAGSIDISNDPLPATTAATALPSFDLGFSGFKLTDDNNATPSPTTTITATTMPASLANIFGNSTINTTTSSPFGALLTQQQTNPTVVSPPTTVSSIFGSPTTPTTANIFAQSPSAQTTTGGFSLFASAPTTATPTPSAPTTAFGSSPSIFGNPPTSQPAFGSAPVFGAGTTPTTSNPAFGGGGNVFGTPGQACGSPPPSSASTFGSAFGSTSPVTSPSPFGGGSSVFGGANVNAGSPFGGQTSIFGSTTAHQPNTNSIFGSNVQTTTSGGGGLFSGGGSTAAQSGFSFAQSPGAFGSPTSSPSSVFGATPETKPAFGSAAVFGSGPAFGGSPAFGASTFGSAFGSSPNASAVGGGSIFGGGSIQSAAPSFGTIAQSAPLVQQQGFGGGFNNSSMGGGGSLFGGGGQPLSPFGQQQQQPQQQSVFGGQTNSPPPASFGGSAFSSWR